MLDRKSILVCYLCGEALAKPVSDDHVPPKQLFGREIRQITKLQLDTVPVHDACNKAFQLDEDYFVHTLMPFGKDSAAGDAVYADVLNKYRLGQKVGLTMRVLEEFEPYPSGLVLPSGKVAKRFQGGRIQRVAWKIVRGLFFIHHNRVLPADTTTWVTLTPPGEVPPEHFLYFMSLPDRNEYGRYPGAFAYRFDNFHDIANLHYWALLIWDRIILTIMFHDPACACPNCVNGN